METSNSRPALVQQQLLQAKQDRESLEAELNLQDPASQSSGAGQAAYWSLTTRGAALRSEIGMLDQELLSMPMRVDLLEAQRDRSARSVKRVVSWQALLPVFARSVVVTRASTRKPTGSRIIFVRPVSDSRSQD
jgi:hypothetical protein